MQKKSDHPDVIGRYLEDLKTEKKEAAVPEVMENFTISIYVPDGKENLIRGLEGVVSGDNVKVEIIGNVTRVSQEEGFETSISVRPDVIEVSKVGTSE